MCVLIIWNLDKTEYRPGRYHDEHLLELQTCKRWAVALPSTSSDFNSADYTAAASTVPSHTGDTASGNRTSAFPLRRLQRPRRAHDTHHAGKTRLLALVRITLPFYGNFPFRN